MKTLKGVRGVLGCGASLMALAIAIAAPAGAQASGPADGRDTVVVVGKTIEETLPQELEKYGSDLETITSEEIREAGYVDVSNALQMDTPGVFLAPRAGPFSYLDISFQGSRTQDMLFLVDGVRINNRLYPGTITDTLPASMVERVEVLKGGQGLFYGTNAAAGVINVVTRGYTDEFDGQFTVGGNTNETFRADAYVRGALGPGNYVLYASKDQSEGFQMFDNAQPSSTNQDRSYDVVTYGAKYRVELGDNVAIDARYQHNDAKLEYLRYNRSAYGANDRDEEIASLGFDFKASDTLQFLVKGYWHDWDTSYTDILNSVLPPYTQTVSSDNLDWGYEDKGVNALAKFTPGGPFEYLAGYDYQTYSARDEVWNIEPIEEEVQAVFGQVRSTPDLIENASFAAGIRYNETGGSDATVWNVSGRFDFTPNLYVQGVAGTNFLLPNAEQLYVIEEFWYLGNPDLEPEESKNLNVSLGGQFGANDMFSWQGTYFAREITNLIDGATFAEAGVDTSQPYRGLVIPGNYDGVFYNVAGEVEVSGFELLGTVGLDNGLRLNGSYTWSESENSGSAIPRIPKEYAKFGADYDAASGVWGANANLIWVGEQASNAGGFGLVNYGDYVVLDIAGHVFLDADQKHKFTVRLENAFDEEYNTRVASGTADAGGSILVGNRGAPQTLHASYSYAF